MGAERHWWRIAPWLNARFAMTSAIRERRSAEGTSTGNGSAEQFQERRRDHRYAQLQELWIACPVCGGRNLLLPSPDIRRRIPEASGACGTCGAAFASGTDGTLRLLVPRCIGEAVRR
jgi:hypothetical protein